MDIQGYQQSSDIGRPKFTGTASTITPGTESDYQYKTTISLFVVPGMCTAQQNGGGYIKKTNCREQLVESWYCINGHYKCNSPAVVDPATYFKKVVQVCDEEFVPYPPKKETRAVSTIIDLVIYRTNKFGTMDVERRSFCANNRSGEGFSLDFDTSYDEEANAVYRVDYTITYDGASDCTSMKGATVTINPPKVTAVKIKNSSEGVGGGGGFPTGNEYTPPEQSMTDVPSSCGDKETVKALNLYKYWNVRLQKALTYKPGDINGRMYLSEALAYIDRLRAYFKQCAPDIDSKLDTDPTKVDEIINGFIKDKTPGGGFVEPGGSDPSIPLVCDVEILYSYGKQILEAKKQFTIAQSAGNTVGMEYWRSYAQSFRTRIAKCNAELANQCLGADTPLEDATQCLEEWYNKNKPEIPPGEKPKFKIVAELGVVCEVEGTEVEDRIFVTDDGRPLDNDDSTGENEITSRSMVIRYADKDNTFKVRFYLDSEGSFSTNGISKYEFFVNNGDGDWELIDDTSEEAIWNDILKRGIKQSYRFKLVVHDAERPETDTAYFSVKIKFIRKTYAKREVRLDSIRVSTKLHDTSKYNLKDSVVIYSDGSTERKIPLDGGKPVYSEFTATNQTEDQVGTLINVRFETKNPFLRVRLTDGKFMFKKLDTVKYCIHTFEPANCIRNPFKYKAVLHDIELGLGKAEQSTINLNPYIQAEVFNKDGKSLFKGVYFGKGKSDDIGWSNVVDTMEEYTVRLTTHVNNPYEALGVRVQFKLKSLTICENAGSQSTTIPPSSFRFYINDELMMLDTTFHDFLTKSFEIPSGINTFRWELANPTPSISSDYVVLKNIHISNWVCGDYVVLPPCEPGGGDKCVEALIRCLISIIKKKPKYCKIGHKRIWLFT